MRFDFPTDMSHSPRTYCNGCATALAQLRHLGILTQFRFLTSINMATTGKPPEPRVDASSNLGEIWKEAVGRYTKDTETKFQDLDRADNADDILI